MHYSFRTIAAFSIRARYLRHSTFAYARRHIFWQEPRRRDPFATLYWMQPLEDATSDVLHCGKSGAEAKVVVGVGARVVEVHVEDAGVATVVPVPAAVRHPLTSRSRLSFLRFIGISSFQHSAYLLANFANHSRPDIVLLWSDIPQIITKPDVFLQYIYGHIQFT